MTTLAALPATCTFLLLLSQCLHAHPPPQDPRAEVRAGPASGDKAAVSLPRAASDGATSLRTGQGPAPGRSKKVLHGAEGTLPDMRRRRGEPDSLPTVTPAPAVALKPTGTPRKVKKEKKPKVKTPKRKKEKKPKEKAPKAKKEKKPKEKTAKPKKDKKTQIWERKSPKETSGRP